MASLAIPNDPCLPHCQDACFENCHREAREERKVRGSNFHRHWCRQTWGLF